MKITPLLCSLLLCISFNVIAMEINTHGVMTLKSYERSILKDENLFSSLGININNNNPFGKIYYDISDSTVLNGLVNYKPTGKIIFQDFQQPLYSIQGWLMRSAIREDDINKDDSGVRVVNHFFDPYFDRALTVNFVLDNLFTPIKAPNWILGTEDAFTVPLTPLPENSLKYNHYTVFHAMDSMYRALTGHDTTGSPNIGPDGTIGDEAVRNAYWATTFRSLGDLVHIIQDMSQPQHTRNDYHGPGASFESLAYEAYTNARATGVEFECAPDDDLLTPTTYHTPPGLKFTLANNVSYPIPQFSKYSDFFSTQRGSQVVNGLGLADYSNSNFFSAGTNLGENNYPSPSNNFIDPSYTYTEYVLTNPCILVASPFLQAFERTTKDNLNQSLNEKIPVSTQGLWNVDISDVDEAASFELQSSMALTRINYEAMADNLIPRAIAYSTGIINHFFRGRLDVTKFEATTDTETSQRVLAVTVKNMSKESASLSKGSFSIFYDAIVNDTEVRKQAQFFTDINGVVVTPGNLVDKEELAVGKELILKVVMPTDIDRSKENPFVVVFKGYIGLDPGVAGKVFSSGNTALLAWVLRSDNYEYELWRSTDMGKKWNIAIPSNFYIRDVRRIYSIGKGETYAVAIHYSTPTGAQQVYHTQDNGLTWQQLSNIEYSLEARTKLVRAEPLGFDRDTGNMVLLSTHSVRETNAAGNIYTVHYPSFSLDKGKTWQTETTPIGLSQLFGFLTVDKDNILAFGADYIEGCEITNCYQYSTYQSVDYGRTWLKIALASAQRDFGVSKYGTRFQSFKDASTVVMTDIISDLYTISVSTDMGQTRSYESPVYKQANWLYARPWSTAYLGNGRMIATIFDNYTCAFIDISKSCYEAIILTEDYGQTWKEQAYRTSLVKNTWPYALDQYGSTGISALGVVTDDPNMFDTIDYTIPPLLQ